jgi:hypothetical protein
MAKEILNEGIADIIFTYQFIRKLTTPFKDTEAFKLGIIDEDGSVLKKSKTLNTQEEKAAYGYFDRLVFGLKRLLEKLPGGKSRIASYAAALYLIKESVDPKEHYTKQDLREGLMEKLTMMENISPQELNKMLHEDYYNVIYKNAKGKVEGEKTFKDEDSAKKHASKGNDVDKVGGTYTVVKVKGVMEDSPTNATGDAVVGTGDTGDAWARKKLDYRFKEMRSILARYQRAKEKRESLKKVKDFKERLGL